MKVIAYKIFQGHLKMYLNQVASTHNPLFVEVENGKEIVVLSKRDYDSMEETLYLLKSPKNSARLLHAIEEYKKGKLEAS